MRVSNITPNYQRTITRARTNNSYTPNREMNTAPSFKGAVPAGVTNGLANFYKTVSSQEWFTNFIKSFSKSNKTFTHVLAFESCLLSGFYMLTTLTNKKIKKEQKPQMIINDALTLGVSTAGAYLVEGQIGDMINKGAENHFKKHKDFYIDLGKEAAENSKTDVLEKIETVLKGSSEKLAEGVDDIVDSIGEHLSAIKGSEGKKTFHMAGDAITSLQAKVKQTILDNKGASEKATAEVKKLIDDAFNFVGARAEANKTMIGINKIKTLVIFGIIYRYLSPVVMTPIANKISAKFFDKKNNTQKA